MFITVRDILNLKNIFSKSNISEPWYKDTIYEIDNYELCKECELKRKCVECATNMLSESKISTKQYDILE